MATITGKDIQEMVRHWLNTPVEAIWAPATARTPKPCCNCRRLTVRPKPSSKRCARTSRRFRLFPGSLNLYAVRTPRTGLICSWMWPAWQFKCRGIEHVYQGRLPEENRRHHRQLPVHRTAVPGGRPAHPATPGRDGDHAGDVLRPGGNRPGRTLRQGARFDCAGRRGHARHHPQRHAGASAHPRHQRRHRGLHRGICAHAAGFVRPAVPRGNPCHHPAGRRTPSRPASFAP